MSLKNLVRTIAESKRGSEQNDNAMKLVISGGEAFEAAATAMAFCAGRDAAAVYLDPAGSDLPDAFADVARSPRFSSYRTADCNATSIADILRFEQPDAILQFAGDASADAALVEAADRYWSELAKGRGSAFRFVHAWIVDEAAAAFGASEPLISARHAASGLPALTIRRAPSFGPFQSPGAKMPQWITNAMLGRDLPVADLGLATTRWLYVSDLAAGLLAAVGQGVPGRRYSLDGAQASSDLEMLHLICELLDQRAPRGDGIPHVSAISMDSEIDLARGAVAEPVDLAELDGYAPRTLQSEGLALTVGWYAANSQWWLPQRLSAITAEPVDADSTLSKSNSAAA